MLSLCVNYDLYGHNTQHGAESKIISKLAIPGLFFFIFVFSSVNSNHMIFNKIMQRTRCELQTSDIWSNRSANWATTTAPKILKVHIELKRFKRLTYASVGFFFFRLILPIKEHLRILREANRSDALKTILAANSVTRLGDFCQRGEILKVFGQLFGMAYFVFGKLLYPLWHFYATGQIFIVVNGQRWNTSSTQFIFFEILLTNS